MLSSAFSGCAGMSEYRHCGYGGCDEDAKITAGIETQLSQHRDLGPPDHVYVQTLDGVVYLSGNVLTAMQRETVLTSVHGTPGVTRTVDNLFVDANSGK